MDLSSLMMLILWLIIVGLICGLLWWLVDFAGVPAPFNKVAKVIIAVVAVFFLINILLGLMGHSVIRLR